MLRGRKFQGKACQSAPVVVRAAGARATAVVGAALPVPSGDRHAARHVRGRRRVAASVASERKSVLLKFYVNP